MRTEPGLAWAGVRHRPGPWLLLALGLALATVMPLAASGLQERATVAVVEQAVAAVPEPGRGVLAVTSRDLRGPELASVSSRVSGGLVATGLPAPTRALAFRSLSLQGTDSTIGALDGGSDLARDVTLTSGRLPATCAPDACEVVLLGAPADAAERDRVTAAARDLGLVVTGTGTLLEPRLVGLGLVAAGQPVLLGSDPAGMAELTALSTFGRNVGWFSPLDGPVVTRQGAAAFTAGLDRVAAEVNPVAGPLNLVWPSDVVLDGAARAQESSRRFAVLGVGAGALQLGFCLVLAAARRPAQQVRATLVGRRGARPGQVLAVAGLQALLAGALGLVVGVAAGLALVGGLAAGVVPDPGAAAARSLASGWPAVLALAITAVAGSVALAAGPAVRPRTVRGVLGLVVLAAAALAPLALTDPSPDPQAPLPVAALVGLVLASGLTAALLWSPVVAGLRRLGGGRHRPLRRITLLTGRRPLLPSVTAGFLAAALATALLAASWSASTARSAQDRAAALVPLDVRVSPSTQVRLPGTVVDAERLEQAGPGVVVSSLTSTTVSAFAGASGATALPLTGIDPDVLPLVRRWSPVTGSDTDPADLAAALRTTPSSADSPPVVPAGTRELVLDVRGLDADVTLGVWLAGADGQEREVTLTRRGDQASAGLDGGAAQIVRALEVTESAYHLDRRQHSIGESTTDRPLPSGTLDLGAVRADGTVLPWSWRGWGGDSVEVAAPSSDAPDGSGLRLGYQIRDARAVVVPGWVAPADRPPVPVVVDAVTAARAGTRGTFGLTLDATTVPVRIVGVLGRMPTLPSRFVLADRAAVAALTDATAPGTAPTAQVWVAAPGPSADAVRADLEGAASAATLEFRADLARELAADPVTRSFVLLLAASAAVALLLVVVAVVGSVRGDRENAVADLFALEVDGVAPRALRRVLLVRGVLVLVVGLPLGLVAGVGLAAVAVRLLGTGPDGRPLNPPLDLVLLSPPTALALLAAVLGTGLAAYLTARGSLTEPRPVAPELELR